MMGTGEKRAATDVVAWTARALASLWYRPGGQAVCVRCVRSEAICGDCRPVQKRYRKVGRIHANY